MSSPRLPAGQLPAQGRIDNTVLEGAFELFVHVGRAFKSGIVADHTLDMLAFQRLTMNGGVARVLLIGSRGNGFFNRSDPRFRRAGTVGVGFRALTVGVVQLDGLLESVHSHIQRALKTVEVASLVEAVVAVYSSQS